MMYIKIISLLLILIGNLNANNSFVRGTVVSEQSEPMAGANIVIENTSRGVITDSEGKFLIDSLHALRRWLCSWVPLVCGVAQW